MGKKQDWTSLQVYSKPLEFVILNLRLVTLKSRFKAHLEHDGKEDMRK
jgi:hypothetical protein